MNIYYEAAIWIGLAPPGLGGECPHLGPGGVRSRSWWEQ